MSYYLMLVDLARIELATSALQVRRAPNYATGPPGIGAAGQPRTGNPLFTGQKHIHLCLSGVGDAGGI